MQQSQQVATGWALTCGQLPPCEVPRHYAAIGQSATWIHYLTTILRLAPNDVRTCEIGSPTGYGAIWLALRGIEAEGILDVPAGVERARLHNDVLASRARFRVGSSDEFEALGLELPKAHAHSAQGPSPYHVIHHWDLVHRGTVRWIRSLLAGQLLASHWVVFSVPSVYSTVPVQYDGERLLPLEAWQRILQPFDVEELSYVGEEGQERPERICCVLRGRPFQGEEINGFVERHTNTLSLAKQPFPEGISAIVHTRNESARIEECLQSLEGWTDEIIVCDMESTDDTVALALKYTDKIVHHPLVTNFDCARNVSAMEAEYSWTFYLDADERVPPRLGAALREMTRQEGASFEALLPPFRHHFANHWLRCLYPGYTAPRLFKNGRFYFNPRLHSGAQVDGRTILFPANDPELALIHHSFDSLSHYLEKLNRYTDGEAENMHRDGRKFHWQASIEDFVNDLQSYYDHRRAGQDGVHGFLYSFLSAFYRFEQHGKLYERRFNGKELQQEELQVPATAEQILEFALAVARRNTEQERLRREQPEEAPQVPVRLTIDAEEKNAARVVWDGPFFSPSGYGEEARNFLFALEAAGAHVAAWPQGKLRTEAVLEPEERARIEELMRKPVAPRFIQICHHIPSCFARQPESTIAIGRTMFETDRLPPETVKVCNLMDYIWVPSEFNRETFARAGVAHEKLRVIPGCIDVTEFEHVDGAFGSPVLDGLPQLVRELKEQERFIFLTVFDWTLHKGWDVLLRAFLEEFQPDEKVALLFKVWSACGFGAEGIQQQAGGFVEQNLQLDLLADSRVQFLHQRMLRRELLDLYRAVDSFVLPSRGEGWGRPYMEAMASGLPVVGTNWSGNTAFMTADNSYLIDSEMRDVPEEGWREVAIYRGHRWAEPDHNHLRRHLRHIFSEQDQARAVGSRARDHILSEFSRERVGRLIVSELDQVQELLAPAAKVTTAKPELLPDASKEQPHEDDLPASSQPGSDPAEAIRSNVSHVDSVTAQSAADAQDTPLIVVPSSPLILPFSLSKQPSKGHEQRPVTVRWEGSQFNWHSLAHVNREFALSLLETGEVELSLVPYEPNEFGPQEDARFPRLTQALYAPLSRAADVHVRHFFPPRLGPPSEGQLVLMQPWEYGYLPERWVEDIKSNVREVWCYSEFVRQVYLDSGISKERLHLVPLGVDNSVFHPQALPYIFSNEPGADRLRKSHGRDGQKPFMFLFTGGTIQRKGIDILLDAFLKAFSAYDDVCLVIKDTGTDTVYRGQHAQERIMGLVDDPTRPNVVYINDALSTHQLAGLYATADCLVQPSRGEGFCLPALEAMACGTPAIVPRGGATDDFVDETVGWRVAAERRPTGNNRVSEWDCVGPTWTLEVDSGDLARLMRTVANSPDEVRVRCEAASMRGQQWSWQRSANAALKRLRVLKSRALRPVGAAKSVIRTSEPQARTERSKAWHGSKAQSSNGHVELSSGKRKQPTISLCMIVRDEERVLGDCLKSIMPWVDEIIVVDTGSKDSTPRIAAEHGARLFHFPWCDDFSAARNESLKHATSEWSLWMDADDTIPAECGRQLRELVLRAEENVTGFMMQVRIPPAPGDHGFTVVDHVKLFRNWPELRFEGRIHEQILEPIHRHGGRVMRTGLYVVHSGYDYSPEGQAKKRERDLTILQKDLDDRPDHPFVLFNIGMTAFHMKEFAKAREVLERCLQVSKPRESQVRKVYAMLAGCHLEQGDKAAARGVVEHGLTLFPNDPELLFRAGIIHRDCGDLVAAERSYVKLLTEHEVGHIDSLDVTMTGFKAHHNLALIYQDMGHLVAAEEQWRAAVAADPGFVSSWVGLGELYLHQQRYADLHKVIEQVEALDSDAADRLRYRKPSETAGPYEVSPTQNSGEGAQLNEAEC